jgi:hypothetical protein
MTMTKRRVLLSMHRCWITYDTGIQNLIEILFFVEFQIYLFIIIIIFFFLFAGPISEIDLSFWN